MASTVRGAMVVDEFSKEARTLRATFDARFAEPREATSERFVWDYWHVPGQYTALRTPAYAYFEKASYTRFHESLVRWGRRTLGCHDVSPPWLSCYVEGCRQELHGDLPHGPFAFVYSLTDWRKRVFRGGETLILRDEVLDFWSDFVSERSVEEGHVIRAIEPRFNRLTVFDPRIPHGVRRVEGTHDPRKGRLVVHGWFVQPRPFLEGPLPVTELAERIDADVSPALGDFLELPLAGMMSFGFTVAASGKVSQVKLLADTTRMPATYERERKALLRAATTAIGKLTFSKRKAASQVTLPLVFERS